MEQTRSLPSRHRDDFWGQSGRWFKRNWAQIILVLSVFILLFEVLFPLYLLLIKSVKTPSDDTARPFSWPASFCWENYQIAWDYIKTSYFNSLLVTVSVSLGSVLFGAMASYAFSRFNFPGKRVLFVSFLGLMMIPGILTLISKYDLVCRLHLVDTYWGVILPAIAGSLPNAILLFTTFFSQIPNDIFESAEMDGANEAQIFARFILPLSRPIIATVLIISFVNQWNDYLWSKLVLIDEDLQTLPVVLVSMTDYLGETLSYGIPFAGYVLSSIPLVLIFIFGSKQLIAGLTSGAVKM
jgi:ABC-type glycerol-3-phosphate transport system permease component